MKFPVKKTGSKLCQKRWALSVKSCSSSSRLIDKPVSLVVVVVVVVIGHLYSALLWDEPIARDAQIWPVIARGSHSFIWHPLTNHTCLYSPATGHHRPLAGTHCSYPRRDGQAELTWVISSDAVLETQVLVSRRLVSDSVLTSWSESCSWHAVLVFVLGHNVLVLLSCWNCSSLVC